MLILPTFTDATAYSYNIVLDGREYLLRFVYDSRTDTWHMHIKTPDGVALAEGVRLVAGIPLLRTYHDDQQRLPPGVLVVLDLGTRPTDPGFSELQDTHRLMYFSALELAQIEADEPAIELEIV